jgi:hypothetical protein
VSEFEVAATGQQPTVTARSAGSPAQGARDRRVRAALVVCGCYLAAALVLTWRLWMHPSSLQQSTTGGDPDQFAWYMRYAATAVMHGHLPALATRAMNAPQGVNLMWNTSVLLPGVLLFPVTVLAGPQVSLTVLLTAGFAGSAASLFWVLRRYRGSLWAAALGGAVYGFSPALLHTGFAHYQLQFAVLPPLIVDAALRMCLRPRRPVVAGAYLGLLVAAQLFTGEEVLAQAALATALVGAVVALSRPRAVLPALRPLATGAAVAAVVFLALAGWALIDQFHGPLRQWGSAFGPVASGNDLASFITPDAWELLHTSASVALAGRSGDGAEYVAYLGVPMLAAFLAIGIVWWRRLPVRACFVAGVVLLVLSLGAHPLVSGTANPLTLHGVSWPWGWFAKLPVLSPLLPSRLPVVADGAVAAVFAFGIDLTWAWLRRAGASRPWAAAIVGSAALAAVLPLVPVPYLTWPISPTPAGWSRTLDALHLPAGARILVVPVPTAGVVSPLRWQAEGGQQISLIGGYFEGPSATGEAAIDGVGFPQLACYLDYLWEGAAEWTSSPACGEPPPALPDYPQLALRWWRPQAVVADLAGKPVLEQYLESLFGRPTVSYGSMAGWRLRWPPLTP